MRRNSRPSRSTIGHPLAGQKLIVHGRVNRNGERVLCRLPDGTVGSLPAWMLRAESSRFTLGKPLVSVDALRELRELLSTLQASPDCGKASLKIMPREGIDETRPPANLPAHKQKDLASALAELLLRAAGASCDSRSERKPNNESETHT
jgi:hypothetical protein